MRGHDEQRPPEQLPAEHPAGRRMDRRAILGLAAAGAVVAIGGILYRPAAPEKQQAALDAVRADGRTRLPPNQRLIEALRPMGGQQGDPDPANFRLRVYGEVRNPLELDYRELLALPQTEQLADVHCVTGWTVFDAEWKGVRIAHLAELAGVKDSAAHVIFEAAHGYTANVPLKEAIAPNCLVAYRLNGEPLPLENGPPVRSLVPDLYFWKSAKWLTGIRFVSHDEPGYWEVRGYHNHADPWLEERYA